MPKRSRGPDEPEGPTKRQCVVAEDVTLSNLAALPDVVFSLIVARVAEGGSAQDLMRLACVDNLSRHLVKTLVESGRDDRALADLRVCRLWWHPPRRAGAVDLLIDLMCRLNSVEEQTLRERLEWHSSGDISKWDLSFLGLHELPESFPVIDLVNDLDLWGNWLTSLPESFGNITVGGNLDLEVNQLGSLPESFGNITVGGNLDLEDNQLGSLPESFRNVTVGGNLDLEDNQLGSLPESFGNITVGGILWLGANQLASLPESFGNITVGGNLDLQDNQLTSLPESFGNVTVGGDLWLYDNQLGSLPESFGNVKGLVHH